MNPLLIKVKLPGRVYQLPSKGVFYKPGVLAETVKDGEITVSPMSALAEMKLRSADLLFSGKVIGEVCRECAPEILKPEQLLTQDVDALFGFLRQVTYGDMHTVQSMHWCKSAKVHEHRINIAGVLADPHNRALAQKDELYKVELSNNQLVYAKPSTYLEAMQSVHQRSELKKLEADTGKVDDQKLEDITILEIMSVVEGVEVTVDEKKVKVLDRTHLIEWIRALPRKQLEELLIGVKAANAWGYEFKVKIKCPDCGELYDHDLELDPINFFFG